MTNIHCHQVKNEAGGVSQNKADIIIEGDCEGFDSGLDTHHRLCVLKTAFTYYSDRTANITFFFKHPIFMYI